MAKESIITGIKKGALSLAIVLCTIAPEQGWASVLTIPTNQTITGSYPQGTFGDFPYGTYGASGYVATPFNSESVGDSLSTSGQTITSGGGTGFSSASVNNSLGSSNASLLSGSLSTTINPGRNSGGAALWNTYTFSVAPGTINPTATLSLPMSWSGGPSGFEEGSLVADTSPSNSLNLGANSGFDNSFTGQTGSTTLTGSLGTISNGEEITFGAFVVATSGLSTPVNVDPGLTILFSPGVSATPVFNGIAGTPEPSSFWLMATGLFGMFGLASLKKRMNQS